MDFFLSICISHKYLLTQILIFIQNSKRLSVTTTDSVVTVPKNSANLFHEYIQSRKFC